MEKYGIRKIIEFYPRWEKFVLEGKELQRIPDSAKIEDYGIVYTKDGKPIDMGHLKREMESAKTAIVSQSPLFAPYVHNFVPIYTWLVPTMATDGTRLFVNPSFANKLTWEQKIFVIIHEIMHCILLHIERLKERDPFIFNIAGDLEINPIIVDTLNDFDEAFMKKLGGLYDKKYLNIPVEKIYEDVKKNIPPMPQNSVKQGNQGSGKGEGQSGKPGKGEGKPGEGKPGEGEGKGKPGEGKPVEGIGGAGDPGSESVYKQMGDYDPAGTGGMIPEDIGKKIAKDSGYKDNEIGPDENAKDKWNVESGKLLKDLEKSKTAGSGTGGALLKTLERLHKGDVNWKNLFRKYVAQALSPEKFWKIGNKKHLGKEYLKRGQRRKHDAIKHIVIMVDTSGSMYSNPNTIPRILNEVNQIIFAKKVKKITVAFFDGDINRKHVQTIINRGPTNTGTPIIKTAPAGGGTNFQKPIDWIEEELKGSIALCVFITDGYASNPTKPKYANKFIWLIYDNPGYEHPFGKQINIV